MYTQGNLAHKNNRKNKKNNRPNLNLIGKKTHIKRLSPAGYCLLFSLCTLVSAFFAIKYIEVRYDISNTKRLISIQESLLLDMKNNNTNEKQRIESNISLEDIKEKAMKNLGMTYPNDEQIVYFEEDDNDYVRQYINLE